VSDLFNKLTGISKKSEYRKLLVAPTSMRTEMLARVEREIAAHELEGEGHIVFKLNALTDKECIKSLYRASQAGVKVQLQVRGICCLRPGVPGLSDNIEVTSIVGRFLEHSRLYYFRNGGDFEILCGSADLMGRNLDRRVEALFPIENRDLALTLRDEVLFLHLRDNLKTWRLLPDGSYERIVPAEGDELVSAQAELLQHGVHWSGGGAPPESRTSL
jgi:polyphosphate kinase